MNNLVKIDHNGNLYIEPKDLIHSKEFKDMLEEIRKVFDKQDSDYYNKEERIQYEN
jgi:predicted RNA-binding protein with EMAP domain